MEISGNNEAIKLLLTIFLQMDYRRMLNVDVSNINCNGFIGLMETIESGQTYFYVTIDYDNCAFFFQLKNDLRNCALS